MKFLSFVTLLSLTSCLTTRHTNIEFVDAISKEKSGAYLQANFFKYKVNHPYHFDFANQDDIQTSIYLVLVDSSLKIRLNEVQPYLIKNNDTIKLKEKERFNLYSYSNISQEPELYIHFDYTVEKKSTGSIQQVKEDIKLYRSKYTFKSVH